MADIEDVIGYLKAQVLAVVYPNGTGSPSITGQPVKLYEGWPIPAQLDLDLAGKMLAPDGVTLVSNGVGPIPNISFYPGVGGNASYQLLDQTYQQIAPAYGMSVSLAGQVITVSGAPGAGEYLTILADRSHIYSTTGASVAAILATLLAAVQVDYPSASVTGSAITIPAGIALVARLGAPGTLARATHRQRQQIIISIWAPDPATRTTLAKAIDAQLKIDCKVTLPDTSQALIVYESTRQTDNNEKVAIYRRDLIYAAEFATLETFPGYVVTSITTDLTEQASGAEATAIT